MQLRVLASPAEQRSLLQLPWDMPLEDWPDSYLIELPQGISRHVVRFSRLGGEVYALKEVVEAYAIREYRLLRDLQRAGAPAVHAVGIVTGREAPGGEPLDPVLVTRHLTYSQPYRSLFSHTMRQDTLHRLIDAQSVLIVRLHLLGFFWGDCSLSNTLFRRDAGAFAAYLVDAETGEIQPGLSDGKRGHDLEIARVNIAGELLDLQAGGMLDPDIDPIDVSDLVVERYERLWQELTGWEAFDVNDLWRISRRVERLNELGFDVDELDIVTDLGGRTVRVQPKVVDAGHHSRRLLRLTGLDVEENQARRLLNDLDRYRAATDQQAEDESVVAHEWLTKVYEQVVRAVPRDLRRSATLTAPEVFHEFLEHRWYMSEAAGREVPMEEAIDSYVSMLRDKAPVPVSEARSGSRLSDA